eukprot:NODE_984_length_2791_cov_0.439822.p1 type:complete len:348 gc:universal NODE_984_length_2791_cov_0.439822:734-1777(+)
MGHPLKQSIFRMKINQLPSDLVQIILNYLTIFEYDGLLNADIGKLSEGCKQRWQNVLKFFDPYTDKVDKFGEFVTEQLNGIPTKDEYDDDLLQHPEILPKSGSFCFMVFPSEYSMELAVYILWKRMFFDIPRTKIELIKNDKIPLAIHMTRVLGTRLHYEQHKYNMIPITCPEWAETMVFTFAEDLRLIYVNDYVLHYSVIDKLLFGKAETHLCVERKKLQVNMAYFASCKPLDYPHKSWHPIILPRINSLNQLLKALGLLSSEETKGFHLFEPFKPDLHMKHFTRDLPHSPNKIVEFATSLLKCWFAGVSDVPMNMGGNRYYFIIGHSLISSIFTIGYVSSTFEDE